MKRVKEALRWGKRKRGGSRLEPIRASQSADGHPEGDRSASGPETTSQAYRLKPSPPRAGRDKSGDSPPSGRTLNGNQPIPEGQEHLWKYINGLPVDTIGVPEYYSILPNGLRDLPYRNVLYPVSAIDLPEHLEDKRIAEVAEKRVFIHVSTDPQDIRDNYVTVEPSFGSSIQSLMEQVDQRLMHDFVGYLKEAADPGKRAAVLLECLDQICSLEGSRSKSRSLRVSQEELEALRYLLLRDKDGMGNIQPLISDPYIEDVSCSGVGSIFIEHRVFGGLKTGINFETEDELDSYVIKLSEKIGRPVTVAEPIVDATLPDGSRVNIVFGNDVAKRGSNFTIRKFSPIPMSVLDLIEGGTLSYEMAAYISLMVEEGMNTFVSGETASGKTTLLNAISTFISPSSKIVSIEDTPELQVPHPNWIREVVRGSGKEETSSVTMFDLLRAALRQRPNEIIIGEIRGQEGAIAFQAMQTGHACMATFHAASVEKLIQRLTGDPINVPKPHVDNLNLVIIMSAVRLPDGRPARRVLSINEIVEFNPEDNSFGFIEVFRWNPSTDSFDFPGYMNTVLLEQTVASKRGIPPRERRKIYDQIEDRAELLKKLSGRGLTNFYELHNILSQASKQGLLG